MAAAEAKRLEGLAVSTAEAVLGDAIAPNVVRVTVEAEQRIKSWLGIDHTVAHGQTGCFFPRGTHFRIYDYMICS